MTKTLTSDNGLALYMPVNVGQALPDAAKWSGQWTVSYERPVAQYLNVFAEANDHYNSGEHAYLADPTTFGHEESLRTPRTRQRRQTLESERVGDQFAG